jgi:hypothetical protein
MMFKKRFKIKGVNNNCSKTGDRQLKLNKILLISLSIFSLNIYASTQSEIIYLLNFVASTDCQYERNGNFYNGKEAFEHINKKYKYYSDDIQSTEDFIKYAASKSKMSGKYYKIHCHNKSLIKSQDWLLNELMIYRKSKN